MVYREYDWQSGSDKPLLFPEGEEGSERLLQTTAHDMQHLLGNYLDIDVPESSVPLSADVLQMAYDPMRPTLAIDALNSFAGAELLGYAAHTIRSFQPNLIYFAGPDHGLERTSGGTVLHHGLLVLPDGAVSYGAFDEPLIVDAVETCDETLLDACHAAGIPTMLDPQLYARCSDKRRLPEILSGLSLRSPRRLRLEEALSSDDPVVIKPARDAQGKGVFLGDRHTAKERLRDIFAFLDEGGYEPIIEERISSYPLRDPLSGGRLDWNVRAVICDGHFVDMYARIDAWGRPVSKSLGAHVIDAVRLADYTDPETARQLRRTLQEAAQQLGSRLDRGVFGADLTVIENGEAVLFEVNAGYVGGLQTLTRLAGPAERLKSAQEVVRRWGYRLNAEKQKTYIAMPAGKLAVSALTYAYALEKINLPVPVDLLKENFTDNYSAKYAAYCHLLEAHAKAQQTYDTGEATRLERELIGRYPLELRSHAASLVRYSAAPEIYQDYVHRMAQLYPEDDVWPYTEALVAIRTFDLPGAREAYSRMGMDPDIRGYAPLTNQLFEELTMALQIEVPDDLLVPLTEACIDAYMSGYEKAAKWPKERLKAVRRTEPRIILNHFLFMLSMAASRPEEARKSYENLRKLNAAASVDDFLQDMRQRGNALDF